MELYDGEKYFHNIPGLLVPSLTKIYDQVDNDINKYIDHLPGLVEAIEATLRNTDIEKRRNFFVKNLEILCLMLGNIFARGLEADAMRILRYVQNDYLLEKADKLIRPFITELLSLSVALQKAQSLEEEEHKIEDVSEIEIHAGLTKNLNTIMSSIDDSEFEEAKRIIIELAVYNPAESELPYLLELINTEQYIKAKNLIIKLREKHSNSIDKIAGVDFTKKVLAVDDMPVILSFVNEALRKHYKVLTAINGKEALKALESQTPDLFLFDIEMPEMDGFTLAKIIRDNAIYAAVPLIFLTGNSSREHIATSMAIGCNDFIIKPTTHEYLLTMVGKYLHA